MPGMQCCRAHLSERKSVYGVHGAQRTPTHQPTFPGLIKFQNDSYPQDSKIKHTVSILQEVTFSAQLGKSHDFFREEMRVQVLALSGVSLFCSEPLLPY